MAAAVATAHKKPKTTPTATVVAVDPGGELQALMPRSSPTTVEGLQSEAEDAGNVVVPAVASGEERPSVPVSVAADVTTGNAANSPPQVATNVGPEQQLPS
jgi:hypothetical protein